jgi:hypothetical protein
MHVGGEALQRGLAFFGHDPGPIDGVIGERTVAAFDDWNTTLPVPDAGITVGPRRLAADVYPDVVGQKLLDGAAAYAGPEEAASSPRTSVTRPPSSTLTVPMIFWRMANPWAWAAVLVPLSLLLGGAGFYFLRSPRGRR